MITLTIMNKAADWTADIQVNPQQRLGDTMTILTEAGKIPAGIWDERTRIQSARKSMFVDRGGSYEQEGIYTGDVLELL